MPEWRLVAVLAITETVSWGVLYYALPVLLVPMRRDLGWSTAEIAGGLSPALLVYGTADPVGTVATWRRVVDLLPRGELQLVDAAAHMPWLDDPSGVADHIRRFLAT